MKVIAGNQECFKNIAQIKFEGIESDNPLAFRWYDADRKVSGMTMAEHLTFACAYGHSLNGNGSDPVRAPTQFSCNYI